MSPAHASAVHASTLRLALSTLIPAAACAVFWLPFLLGVEVALGFAAGFVPGALAGCAAIPLVPLFAAARPVRAALALGAAVVLAFLVLWSLPDRTLAAPIWTNTAHVQTDDASSWSIATYGAEMPDLLADTPTETARLLPWARWLPTAQVATAPRHAEPPPRAEVSELESSDVHRRLRLKLTSPRGATTFVLGFPAGAVEIASIRSGDLVARGNLPSWSPLTFVGIGPEGVELELVQLDRSSWRFDLADARSGIPGELVRPFAADPLRVPRGRGDVSIVATTFAP